LHRIPSPPAEKPGKEWRLRRTDVEAFIERARVKLGEAKAAPPRSGGSVRHGNSEGPGR
jgi:hypothetical protein